MKQSTKSFSINVSLLKQVAEMIRVVSPGTHVVMNKVPKTYAVYDLYFNLVPDEDN